MSGLLPQEFIDQVKSSVDMLELASRYTSMNPVGAGVYGGICPHEDHQDDNPSFTVFVEDNSWCCYGCHHGKKLDGGKYAEKNYGSDCFAFLQWLSKGKIGWRQAVLILAEELGIPLPDDKHAPIYEANFKRAKSFHDNLLRQKRAMAYLKSRGLELADLKEWGVGFDGQKITFPLLDRHRRVLGFTKRWLVVPEGCRDKYRNSPNSEVFNKSNYFYGIHRFDPNHHYVYITEGSMDVILAAKYELPNVFAILGTSFTDGHAEAIAKMGLVPVIIMDSDSSGIRSMNKIITILSKLGIYCKIVILPDKKDLADIALEQKELLQSYIEQHAMTYGYYKVSQIMTTYMSRLSELKLQTMPLLKEALAEVPEEERSLIFDLIRETTGITF